MGSELGVTRRDGLSEEGERPRALEKNGAETRAGRVALDDEVPVKIRQLEDRRRREGLLQRPECEFCIVIPPETLLEEGGERSRDDAEVADQAAVIPGQPEEVAHRPGQLGNRPIQHRLDLLLVHGDTLLGDDVA